jgi:predicted dehydrogenase
MPDVAIVGAGYTAKEHAKAFADVPGARLAGIISRTRARAEALASEVGIAAVYDSIDELYEKTHASVVVVTVPELFMREVATRCFAHPWTVLLEKPAGFDLEDAERLHAAFREHEQKAGAQRAFVAFNRRAMSSTIAVREALGATTGKRFIKVQDQESQARALAAGQPKQVVDNWMFANAIHMIDYFHTMGRGKITDVEHVVPWNAADPGVVVSKLHYDSGDIGLYEGIWHGPGPWAVSVTVPGQRWEMRPLEQAATQELGKPAATLPAHAWDTAFKPGYRLQAELALAASLGQPASDPLRRLATLDDSLETMRLVRRLFPA